MKTRVSLKYFVSYYRFYTQPEIHEQGNPRRPNTATHQICPCMWINKIDKIPNNSYLVSLDVRSLHASISNSENIKAVKTSLEKFS